MSHIAKHQAELKGESDYGEERWIGLLVLWHSISVYKGLKGPSEVVGVELGGDFVVGLVEKHFIIKIGNELRLDELHVVDSETFDFVDQLLDLAIRDPNFDLVEALPLLDIHHSPDEVLLSFENQIDHIDVGLRGNYFVVGVVLENEVELVVGVFDDFLVQLELLQEDVHIFVLLEDVV